MPTISTLPAAQSATLLPLLKQVHALHVAAHPDIYAPITDETAITTWFAAHCDAKGTKILTAQDGAQIIGFAILKLSPRHTHTPLHHPQRTGVVDMICVHPDYQRRGVAGTLMTHAKPSPQMQGPPNSPPASPRSTRPRLN